MEGTTALAALAELEHELAGGAGSGARKTGRQQHPEVDTGAGFTARLVKAVTGLFKLGSFGYVVIGAALAAVAALVVYSYVVWRSDPAKQPPGGTPPADEE